MNAGGDKRSIKRTDFSPLKNQPRKKIKIDEVLNELEQEAHDSSYESHSSNENLSQNTVFDRTPSRIRIKFEFSSEESEPENNLPDIFNLSIEDCRNSVNLRSNETLQNLFNQNTTVLLEKTVINPEMDVLFDHKIKTPPKRTSQPAFTSLGIPINSSTPNYQFISPPTTDNSQNTPVRHSRQSSVGSDFIPPAGTSFPTTPSTNMGNPLKSSRTSLNNPDFDDSQKNYLNWQNQSRQNLKKRINLLKQEMTYLNDTFKDTTDHTMKLTLRYNPSLAKHYRDKLDQQEIRDILAATLQVNSIKTQAIQSRVDEMAFEAMTNFDKQQISTNDNSSGNENTTSGKHPESADFYQVMDKNNRTGSLKRFGEISNSQKTEVVNKSLMASIWEKSKSFVSGYNKSDKSGVNDRSQEDECIPEIGEIRENVFDAKYIVLNEKLSGMKPPEDNSFIIDVQQNGDHDRQISVENRGHFSKQDSDAVFDNETEILEDDFWSCSDCTYKNDEVNLNCVICSASKN